MNTEQHVSAAEKRFYSASRRIRQLTLSKEQQVEASYMIDDILRYNFNFFPNHYLWEKLEAFERFINNAKTA